MSARGGLGDLTVKDLARSHREASHSGDRREQSFGTDRPLCLPEF